MKDFITLVTTLLSVITSFCAVYVTFRSTKQLLHNSSGWRSKLFDACSKPVIGMEEINILRTSLRYQKVENAREGTFNWFSNKSIEFCDTLIKRSKYNKKLLSFEEQEITRLIIRCLLRNNQEFSERPLFFLKWYNNKEKSLFRETTQSIREYESEFFLSDDFKSNNTNKNTNNILNCVTNETQFDNFIDLFDLIGLIILSLLITVLINYILKCFNQNLTSNFIDALSFMIISCIFYFLKKKHLLFSKFCLFLGILIPLLGLIFVLARYCILPFLHYLSPSFFPNNRSAIVHLIWYGLGSYSVAVLADEIFIKGYFLNPQNKWWYKKINYNSIDYFINTIFFGVLTYLTSWDKLAKFISRNNHNIDFTFSYKVMPKIALIVFLLGPIKIYFSKRKYKFTEQNDTIQ